MPDPIDQVRAVAFDLDGTLIDTMGDLTAAVNLMLSMLGARELPEPRVRALVGNGVEQLVVGALAESTGAGTHPAGQSAALELFRRVYGQGLFKRSRVYPEVADTLRELSAAGLALVCITNKSREFAVPLLEQAGLAGHLAFTLCGDRPEDRKPSPRMLLAACSRLNITPAQLVYVGDSGVDVAAGRAASCDVVAVSYGYAKEPAAITGANRIIDRMSDLVMHCLGRAPARAGMALSPGAA